MFVYFTKIMILHETADTFSVLSDKIWIFCVMLLHVETVKKKWIYTINIIINLNSLTSEQNLYIYMYF